MLHQTVKWQWYLKMVRSPRKEKDPVIYVYATNGCAQKIKVVVK